MKMNKITLSATRTALFFTIFVFLLLESSIIHADPYSYGENDTYLGQVVDNYFNDDYVNVTDNVVYNSTLYCMELNQSGILPIIENFSVYTEVDVGANRITFPNDTCVKHVSLRSEVTYLYEDYEVNAFYEYDILFEVYIDNEQQYARGIPFMLSNNVGNQKAHFDNLWNFTVLEFYRGTTTPSQRTVSLMWWHGGPPPLNQKVSTSNYPLDTWLYVRIRQNATHISAWIYDDENMTSLFTLLEVTIEPRNYRYVYSASGYGPTASGNWITYLNKDMSLFSSGGYVSSGYYITIDYLEGNRALNILYNASIVTNTNIKMEFFNGSGEWVNHNNVLGFESLVDGFESIDLRDLNSSDIIVRVNMSTTDGLVTPRMYQLRYVTIVGEVKGGNPTPAIIVALFLILVGSGLIYGVRRKR